MIKTLVLVLFAVFDICLFFVSSIVYVCFACVFFCAGALYGTLRRLCPSSSGAASSTDPAEDSIVIAMSGNAGNSGNNTVCSAGVYLTAWEMSGDVNDTPSDVYVGRPIKQVSAGHAGGVAGVGVTADSCCLLHCTTFGSSS